MSLAAFVALVTFAGVILGVSIGWRLSKGLPPIRLPQMLRREPVIDPEPEAKTERRKL